jgi:hypothetical protein
MPLFFKYFWFIGAAFMFVNLLIWRQRFAPIVDRGIATRMEADRFIFGIAAWFVGAPLFLGAISMAAGWPSPFCAGILQFDSAPRALVSAMSLAAWAALLWWIWRGGGAEFLARVGPALARRPDYEKQYSPALVRAFVTGFVLLSGIGGAIVWRTMPASSEFACAASTILTHR